MKDKKKQSFLSSFSSFSLAVLAILALRWLLFEPYVIPSGSMLPTLLIHDHILVNKLAYGVRYPFLKKWLIKGDDPERGDIVVFRAVNRNYFMVKRVVGAPGDRVEVFQDGQVEINGSPLERRDMGNPAVSENQTPYYVVDQDDVNSEFGALTFFEEKSGDKKYRTLKILGFPRGAGVWTVPDDHLLMMGDNRDNSEDSRMWGYLPIDHVMGKAMFVWLSCDNTIPYLPFLCNPLELRWKRFFHNVE